SDVAMHVLIELSGEAVVARAFVRKVDAITVEGGIAALIEMVGVVVGPHVRVANIELIVGIVFVAALGKSGRSTNQCGQEQEKNSGHSGRLLVDPDSFRVKLYGYINTANIKVFPDFSSNYLFS